MGRRRAPGPILPCDQLPIGAECLKPCGQSVGEKRALLGVWEIPCAVVVPRRRMVQQQVGFRTRGLASRRDRAL